MSADEVPLLDKNRDVANAPNKPGDNDWRNWLFAKAFGTIVLKKEGADAMLLSNQKREPAIVLRDFGKGKITSAALNLDIQLLEAVPGAHRLLSNLLSYCTSDGRQ